MPVHPLTNRRQVVIESLAFPELVGCGVTLYMARADSLHPLASGNKLYKLRPVLEATADDKNGCLLSFGGAYSNHIHALALMCQQHNKHSIGIIRGEAHYASNPTLTDVTKAGMQLHFVSREEYKLRHCQDYLQRLQQQFPAALIVPEGGSSVEAVRSCADLAHDINAVQESDCIVLPCGTGATFAGVVTALQSRQVAVGYSVLKDVSLAGRVCELVQLARHNDLAHDDSATDRDRPFHIEAADFGGYAKLNQPLIQFVLQWLDATGILLDPVYTSKMCMQVYCQVQAGVFARGTKLMLIHTGGLQGWRGMRERVVRLAGESAWQRIAAAMPYEGLES